MPALLLDTCAVIWISAGKPIASATEGVMRTANANNSPIYLSPITAWELGLLVSRGRMPSTISEQAVLDRILAQPSVGYAQMPPEVLIDASYLPGTPPNDPADRIIIATAREYAMTIVTRDRLILKYANEGHVKALAC